MHSAPAHRRGKPRSRILYWFRTPPGVRVGRSALDEDAIRLIEQHNPQVDFDWTRILKGQDAPAEPPPRPVPFTERRVRPRPSRESHPVPQPGPAQNRRSEPAPANDPEPIRPIPVEAVAEDPLPAIEPEVHRPDVPPTAALARLGSEGLSRLRARHAEVLARISEKIADAARRDELKSEAERLNPDTWVTDAEVSAGLEAYESVFESLRGVVGRRRKRRRRPSSGDLAGASGAAERDAAASEAPDSESAEGNGGDSPTGEDV